MLIIWLCWFKMFFNTVAPLIYGGICHDSSSVVTNIMCPVHVVHHLVDKRYFFMIQHFLFIYFHFSSSVLSYNNRECHQLFIFLGQHEWHAFSSPHGPVAPSTSHSSTALSIPLHRPTTVLLSFLMIFSPSTLPFKMVFQQPVILHNVPLLCISTLMVCVV